MVDVADNPSPGVNAFVDGGHSPLAEYGLGLARQAIREKAPEGAVQLLRVIASPAVSVPLSEAVADSRGEQIVGNDALLAFSPLLSFRAMSPRPYSR